MRLITFQNIELAQELLATGKAHTSREYAMRTKWHDKVSCSEPPIYCFARVNGYVPSIHFFVHGWGTFMGFMKFGQRVIVELEVHTSRFINMKDVNGDCDSVVITDNYIHNLFYNPALDDLDTEVLIPDLRLEEVVAMYVYSNKGYSPTMLEPAYQSCEYVPCIRESFAVSGDGYYREREDAEPHRKFGYAPMDIPGTCPAFMALRLLRDARGIAQRFGFDSSRDFEDKLKEDQTTWDEVLRKGGI